MKTSKLKLGEADYPRRLYDVPNPPTVLTTSGPLVTRRAVAIVGSRRAGPEVLRFAHDLAFQLASAGVVVVSGGAIGVDGAAHRGAMAAGGATWVVSPTGRDHVYPPQHASLFAEIAASEDSRMLWSFDDDVTGTGHNMKYRNGVLAALSEALVVIQALFNSGSQNAMSWARDLHRPIWAVPAPPWMPAFCGSVAAITSGLAKPLYSTKLFFEELVLGEPVEPPPVDLRTLHTAARNIEEGAQKHAPASKSTPLLKGVPRAPDTSLWSENEKLIFSALSVRPMHIDKMVGLTRLPVPPVTTALLTLCLKDVVVEGPEGFFRRKKAV